jgi:alkylated DNA repair protein (DNA oxidative demethylase)
VGLRYQPDVLSVPEAAALVAHVRDVEFAAVALRGQVARRRAAHFGWAYDYGSARIAPGADVPPFLDPVRDRVAPLAGVEPAELVEAMIIEYRAGAGIGWHVDAPQFGVVVGVSLLGACRLRFRRRGDSRETRELALEPRSAYVLAGAARWQWEHCIPPVKGPRYSVTFRTLRPDDSPDGSR